MCHNLYSAQGSRLPRFTRQGSDVKQTLQCWLPFVTLFMEKCLCENVCFMQETITNEKHRLRCKCKHFSLKIYLKIKIKGTRVEWIFTCSSLLLQKKLYHYWQHWGLLKFSEYCLSLYKQGNISVVIRRKFIKIQKAHKWLNLYIVHIF